MTLEECIGEIETIKNFFKRLEKELPQKMANDYSKHAISFATQAIYDFYYSYDPFKYKRTGNLLNLSNGININLNNKSIEVEFSTDYMNDYKHDSAEYVSTGAFQYGIHGTSEIYVSSPTPIEIFKEKSYQFLTDQYEFEIENVLKKLI